MWKCPVCDQENTAATVCPTCGYDRTCDYERYPTAFAVTTATPTRTLRRQWQAKQGPALMELVAEWLFDPDDGSAAERCLRRPADGGDPTAQYWLGIACARGWGAKKDEAQAAQWFDKSARQGYVPARLELGNCFRFGVGVDKDDARAAQWFRKSAEQGYAPAQCQLGDCYLFGRGVDQDYAQAARWYQKAAQQNYEKAQLALADCYEKGRGVPKNPTLAARWRTKNKINT